MRNIVNALFVRDGAVLLARRSPHRSTYAGLWSFPGGHVEPGEMLIEALALEQKLTRPNHAIGAGFTYKGGRHGMALHREAKLFEQFGSAGGVPGTVPGRIVGGRSDKLCKEAHLRELAPVDGVAEAFYFLSRHGGVLSRGSKFRMRPSETCAPVAAFSAMIVSRGLWPTPGATHKDWPMSVTAIVAMLAVIATPRRRLISSIPRRPTNIICGVKEDQRARQGGCGERI